MRRSKRMSQDFNTIMYCWAVCDTHWWQVILVLIFRWSVFVVFIFFLFTGPQKYSRLGRNNLHQHGTLQLSKIKTKSNHLRISSFYVRKLLSTWKKWKASMQKKRQKYFLCSCNQEYHMDLTQFNAYCMFYTLLYFDRCPISRICFYSVAGIK